MKRFEKSELLTGDITSAILKMAFPLMGIGFIQMAYTLTDIIWLGRLSTGSVSAVGTVGFFVWITESIILIGKTGVVVGLSQAHGRRDDEEAEEVMRSGAQIHFLIGALLIAFYLIFALLGGFLGWIETMLPFTPLVVAIMLALGLDSLVAVSIVIVGLMAGFCAGPTNVLTVGIAQQISELPLFSGFSLRFVVWIIFLVGSLAYILAYANKIKKDPSKSLVADIDTSDLKYDFSTYEGKNLNAGQSLSLLALLGAFLLSLYGMFKLKWSINDMTAVFLLCGVIAGLLNKMSGDEIVNSLIEGAKSAMGGALIVGIARGVQWILETTSIVDTIINSMANVLSNTSALTAGIGIIIAVSLLNGLVPSGSGKAMALIPLIIPLGDLIGLNRQITTLCYQFGDGITNMIWFTYGSLLMFLSYGKVPYNKYLRFMAPLIIFFFIVAIGAVYIAIKINYGPF